MNKKKIQFIIFILLIAFAAIGAKAIDLIVTVPIIDLNLLVSDSVGTDSGDNGSDDGNSKEEETIKPSYVYDPPHPTDPVVVKHKECNIVITGETVNHDYLVTDDLAHMQTRIQDHLDDGVQVIYLIDKYAEYNTYISVDEMLKEMLGTKYDSIVVHKEEEF